MTENKTQLTYSWSRTRTNGNVFLLSAEEIDGNITVNYLADSLKSKYSVTDDFSLKVENLDLSDSGIYICSFGVIKTSGLEEKHEYKTQLFVQGLLCSG